MLPALWWRPPDAHRSPFPRANCLHVNGLQAPRVELWRRPPCVHRYKSPQPNCLHVNTTRRPCAEHFLHVAETRARPLPRQRQSPPPALLSCPPRTEVTVARPEAVELDRLSTCHAADGLAQGPPRKAGGIRRDAESDGWPGPGAIVCRLPEQPRADTPRYPPPSQPRCPSPVRHAQPVDSETAALRLRAWLGRYPPMWQAG